MMFSLLAQELRYLKKIRRNFERFCYKHRNIGIPNLMLYISIGSALVYLMTSFTGNPSVFLALSFDKTLILKGQIWRLFTYPLTSAYISGNFILVALSLFCYYTLGRAMENQWGTLRFNLYYFTGVLMMDVFCMLFDGYANAYYLNLSLFLGYATLYPNAQFLLFYIIPVKAWIFALVDLGLTFYDVIRYAYYGIFPFCLFPLVALLNYFLFFGKDVLNVIPLSWRINCSRLFRKKKQKPTQYKTVPFPTAGSYQATTARPRAPYNHICTVCGRTDITNPELEFRYCSRCNGYYCYCEDHISNHTHVQ